MASHHRALFFELYAGTHIFERQVKSASNIFKKMGDDFKGVLKGVETSEEQSLSKRLAAAQSFETKVTEQLKAAVKERAAAVAAMEAGTFGATTTPEDLAAMAAAQADARAKIKLQEEALALAIDESAEAERIEAIERRIVVLRNQDSDIELRIVAAENEQVILAQTYNAELEKRRVLIANLTAEAEKAKLASAAAQAERGAVPISGRGGSVLSLIGDAAQVAIPVVGALTVALGGAFMMLDHLTMSAAKYGMAMLQLASVTGITTNELQSHDKQIKNSTFDLQVWNDLMGYFGISAEKIQTIFVRLNKTLAEHPEHLRALGISAKDASGVLLQLSELIPKIGNDMSKMATVEAALGGNLRGTIEGVTAMLNMGKDGIQRYADSMDRLGLIMTDTQIKAAAVTDAIHGQMTLALKGLERQVGQALFPVMDALFLMITSGAHDSATAFSNIANVVANVVGTIVGFVYGLFGGTKERLHEMIEQAKGLSKAASDQAAGAANLANAKAVQLQNEKKLIENLQDADQKLNDQKTANTQRNTDLQKAMTDSVNDQTKALDAQIKTINDNSAEYQKKLNLELQGMERTKQNLDDEQKLQDDLGQSVLARLQAESDLLSDTNERRRHGNENLYDYTLRLRQIDLKDQIKAEQGKRKTASDTATQQIDLKRQQTQDLIAANTEQVKSYVDALNAQKQALTDNLKDRKDAMDLAVQQENNALTAQVRFNEGKIKELRQKQDQANADEVSGATITSGQIQTTFDTMWTAIEKSGALAAVGTGQTWRDELGKIFSGQDSIINGATMLGTAIGNALIDAMDAAITNKVVDFANSPEGWFFSSIPGVPELIRLHNKDSTVGGAVARSRTSAGNAGQGAGSALAPYLGGLTPSASNNSQIPTGHAEGGITTAPTLSWLSERGHREVVIPFDDHARARQLMAQTGLDRLGGGGTTMNVYYSGPVADTLVASRVNDRLMADARRRGLVRMGTMS